tara:strand:- start:13105 stop:13719 length:615 start_codon:yes stop_codon:yes gene_type:complete
MSENLSKINQIISTNNTICIDIGCGPKKISDEYLGIDIVDYEGVDLIGDAIDIIKNFPDESVDKVYTSHFLEHINHFDIFIKELIRIVKPNGSITIIVPHFSNPYYYSDPTHNNHFGLYTLFYYAESTIFKRKIPNYSKIDNLFLEKVFLTFKSPPPFYFRYLLKKLIQFLVNINSYTKEFYEENLTWLFPCYEINYQLKKIKK